MAGLPRNVTHAEYVPGTTYSAWVYLRTHPVKGVAIPTNVGHILCMTFQYLTVSCIPATSDVYDIFNT